MSDRGKLTTPWRITFDTNPDDCNLSCIMCEEFSSYSNLKQLRVKNGDPRKRRMDFKIIEDVLKKIDTSELSELIPSTMGEPLLYRNFEDIIRLCDNYSIKLNLTTNGTFPKKSAKEWAELIVPVTSDVKISWNGANKSTAEKIMKGIDFEKNVQNVKDFIKVRDRIHKEGGNFCRVTLQVTFLEINYEEFPELVKMAAELGVNRIKGHHLWAHFDEIKSLSMRRDKISIEKWNETVQLMYLAVEKYKLPNNENIILDNFYEIDGLNNDQLLPNAICPFLGREAWIAWDGRFNPCCAPDEQRKELGDFGNATIVPFLEIWNSQEYNLLVENYPSYDLCKSCNMRRPVADVMKV